MAVIFLNLKVSIPVSPASDFFSGDSFVFKKKPFSMSEFACFKNIYMSIYKTGRGGGQGLNGMSS